MKRAPREALPRQGVVLPETPVEKRELAALAEDIQELRGRPLRLRLRNFSPTAVGYMGALGGPLPYMLRLRGIAEQTADHERRLRLAWHELALNTSEQDAFATAWTATVGTWSFDKVNEVIERHNRYYPVESGLPMDPATRNYALLGGQDYRCAPLDPAWALERFPVSRELALRQSL